MGTKRKQLTLHEMSGAAVMDLGSMDIWDGADLALIRDTLVELIVRQRRRVVGVDLTHVKYIPSGFFGMLCDWHDKGIEVRLYAPQPNVRNMLWFRQFTESAGSATPAESAATAGPKVYRLTSLPQEELRPEGVGHWDDPITPEAAILDEEFPEVDADFLAASRPTRASFTASRRPEAPRPAMQRAR